MAAADSKGVPQFASLYVGDLHTDVTEAMLYEIFNSVGPVASIRVCRDSVTRRSLGYGYVNFHAVSDAERALDTLNYSSIKGRACRIMWSHRDPSLRKSGVGNVFVKNLDRNIDNKALYDTFSIFGNMLSCKVASDINGKSRGYGFVHYETEEAAKQSIERVNGMVIGDKQVFVGAFVKRDARERQDQNNFTNLFVKCFPQDWDEAKIGEVFGKIGTVTSSVIMTDKKNRKFAFVNYESNEQAQKAISELHKSDMRSEEEKAKGEPEEVKTEDDHPTHLLYVQRAQSKQERQRMLKDQMKGTESAPADPRAQGVNLFVKNLEDTADDEKLKELFSSFGEITSSVVMKDEKGTSKGFGFVCFKTPDEATKAVTEMHLKVVKGKPLYVGLAEKKDARLDRLRQRYQPGGASMPGGGKGMGGKGMPGGKGMMPGGGGPIGMMGGPMGMMGGKGMMPGNPQQMMMMGGKGMGPMGPMGGPMMMPQGMPQGKGMPQMMMMQQQQMMQQQMMMMQGKGMPQMMGKGGPMMGKGGAPMGGMPQMMGKGAPPPQQMQPQPAPNAPLTAAALAAASPGMQKQMLGEKLYPLVAKKQPELAGKIVGMMLEMDNSELLMQLESDQMLNAKINEAMTVLQSK